jgi:hypothetical protein
VLTRLTAVAIAASFLAAGCGGGPSRRTVVARYIDSVNSVEAKLATPLLEVSKANRDFAKGHATPAALITRLDRSQRTIHRLTRQLAALETPPEARRLRSLLLQLIDRENELVGEVEQLARFVPRYRKALKPLAPADSELKRALAAKTGPAVKAAALETFAGRAAAVETELRALDPPPASRPTWSQQVATVDQVGSVARALGAALRAKRAKAIPGLVHQFDLAAAGAGSQAAQRASIAAITAYNLRIKRLNDLGARIGREEARLSRTLS